MDLDHWTDTLDKQYRAVKVRYVKILNKHRDSSGSMAYYSETVRWKILSRP